MIFKVKLVLIFGLLIHTLQATNNDKPSPTITRTEIRVAKSLNTEDTQTLNVMTKDGSVAQLIVKKRDGKSKSSSTMPSIQTKRKSSANSDITRSFYSNWIPVQSMYLHPNLLRLSTFALLRNNSEDKPAASNTTVVPTTTVRLPIVPKPVTVRSTDILIKPSTNKTKKARSLVEIDSDGIPVVHGIRVPDDESDEKIWRNARVINGELVPYEDGYKPPAAVPIGELIYASNIPENSQLPRGIGPFSTSDNFRGAGNENAFSFGPFTIKDNQPIKTLQNNEENGYVKFNDNQSVGPFTVADNIRTDNSDLLNYLKEINAEESRKNYYSRRRLRSYDKENAPQMQRRMLQTDPVSFSSSTHQNSLSYTPVNVKLGVRTPILQYAHPEFGVQPAKANNDDDYNFKDTDVNRVSYDTELNSDQDFKLGGRYSNTPYHSNSINSIDYYKKDVVNYPYNGYYIKTKTEQPFWMKLTESIKDNVQSGFEKVHQLTRPVFDPIVEATHKISHNLGLVHGPTRAQEKLGVVTPMGSSIILPALGLVAGGAALGLGAAAVGRFLQLEDTRNLQYPNDIFVIMEEATNQQVQGNQRRLKRSLERFDEEYLQNLSNDVKDVDLQHLISSDLWSDTPCAKKVFCRIMINRNPDEVITMEKKIDSLLSTVHPVIINTVSHHLQEVMDAVKLGNCSKFVCSKHVNVVL